MQKQLVLTVSLTAIVAIFSTPNQQPAEISGNSNEALRFKAAVDYVGLIAKLREKPDYAAILGLHKKFPFITDLARACSADLKVVAPEALARLQEDLDFQNAYARLYFEKGRSASRETMTFREWAAERKADVAGTSSLLVAGMVVGGVGGWFFHKYVG